MDQIYNGDLGVVNSSCLLFVRLGPSPKLKLQLKGLDQRRTLNSHIITHQQQQQTFLPVPGYTFS